MVDNLCLLLIIDCLSDSQAHSVATKFDRNNSSPSLANIQPLSNACSSRQQMLNSPVICIDLRSYHRINAIPKRLMIANQDMVKQIWRHVTSS
ncbi:hypothetical protein CDAR_487711 [Caerostris darwini]|uniref:Secreted protein n=1 Tax=Caerostris darwini TaxID=1538125 RepID=A0AAV4PV35_9ARAC|nr:hypothetical protein CDAR_487711 [Caerostris darwini]